jgi:hypothetical protein
MPGKCKFLNKWLCSHNIMPGLEIAQIFIKHNAATKVLTFPTTDIGHPSFS